jgi:uroporphyrinogen decarboxylase
MMKQADYEELLLPYDLRVLEALPKAAWFNILHLCGSELHFELARHFPVQVVSWSIHNRGNPSLAEGRKISGKAVMGGLAQRTTLYRGLPEQVRSEVRSAVAETGGKGVFVAPGCSARPGTRPANLEALVEAVRAA